METHGLRDWITPSVRDGDDQLVAAERFVADLAIRALEQIPSALTQLRQRAKRGVPNKLDHLVIDQPESSSTTELRAQGWSPSSDEPARLPHSDDRLPQLLVLASGEPTSHPADGVATDVVVRHVAIRVDDVIEAADDALVHGLPVEHIVHVSASGQVHEVRHRPGGEDQPTFGLVERSIDDNGNLDLSLDLADEQPWFEDSDGARRVVRPAYTFKVRRRHLSAKRQAEFDEWIGKWSVDVDGPTLDWDKIFDRNPTDSAQRRNGLDVGFGHGETTIGMARAEPGLDVIGIEVHDPGVVTVLDAIENEPLRNIRVVHGDVLRFLRRIDADTLDVVRIFFPDPWTKVRQRHRRLVHGDVVAALADRLRPGGVLHLATDIADYAAQMQAACDAEPRLTGGVIARPDARPLTRFEQRGIDAGRAPFDLWYERL